MTAGACQDGSMPAEPPIDPDLFGLALRATGDEAVVVGVCAAWARRLGLRPITVRACLTVLALAGGFGVGLYAAGFLWARRTSGTTDDASRPAPAGPEPRREVRPGGEFGAWAFTIGLISELRNWWPGVDVRLLIPATLVAIGTSIGWRAPGDSGERRAGALLGRLLGGSMLVVVGLGVFASQRVALSTLRDASLAVLVASAGVALVAGPGLARLVRSITAERDERVRQAERAAVAEHLHDSVLQTLTLIQRHPEDREAVATLARRQERDLRRWLYGGAMGALGGREGSMSRCAESIEAITDEVEDHYGVTVEAVVVGDGPVSAPVEAALAAAREALVNAAKFSGERTVSLFAEIGDATLDLYVRDRGTGFDLQAVPADRHGIAGSIRGRIERAGGRVAIRTAPGEGTEVSLSVPLAAEVTP